MLQPATKFQLVFMGIAPGTPDKQVAGMLVKLIVAFRMTPDQARNFVQPRGIMNLDSLRELDQAFVVTHGGNVAWNDRRYRADRVSRNGWHRISSRETRRDGASGPIESNWRPQSVTPDMTE